MYTSVTLSMVVHPTQTRCSLVAWQSGRRRPRRLKRFSPRSLGTAGRGPVARATVPVPSPIPWESIAAPSLNCHKRLEEEIVIDEAVARVVILFRQRPGALGYCRGATFPVLFIFIQFAVPRRDSTTWYSD